MSESSLRTRFVSLTAVNDQSLVDCTVQILITLVPGKEPKRTINAVLRPIIDDLLQLSQGVNMHFGNQNHQMLVQVLVAQTLADDPGENG